MPDFAPNATSRYRLKYNVAGRVHTVQCRLNRSSDAALVQTDGAAYLRSVFDALKVGMADDLAFVSAEYAMKDSDLFFPTAVPAAVTGAISAATFSIMDGITHLTFSGRSTVGSRINQKIYGVQLSPDVVPAVDESDFLLTSAENAAVAAAITALNVSPSGRVVAIDNAVAIYHERATVKVNDFWLKRVRQGL